MRPLIIAGLHVRSTACRISIANPILLSPSLITLYWVLSTQASHESISSSPDYTIKFGRNESEPTAGYFHGTPIKIPAPISSEPMKSKYLNHHQIAHVWVLRIQWCIQHFEAETWIAAILQTTYLSAFSWNKNKWITFNWNMYFRIKSNLI